MSRILVTGGAGFIGSHLCARLARDGHEVVSLDRCKPGDGPPSSVTHWVADTADIDFRLAGIDTIFHLGEYARVGTSFSEPELVYRRNIIGTAGVLRFWQQTGAKLIYAGSSTKFGDAHSPYSLTKLANAEMIRATGECFSLPYAIAYLCNAYGPGERAGKYGTLIEIFRQAYLAGLPLPVRAPGTQRRNFTHVHDLVDGLIKVAELGKGDGYVLAHPESYSVNEVAEMFGGEWVMEPAASGDRSSAAVNPAKSRALGWTAQKNLPDYIAEIIGAPSTSAQEAAA